MALTAPERAELESYVRTRSRIPAMQLRADPVDMPPELVHLVQRGAREHPSGKIRRECLGVLDHQANDASVGVFRAAVLFDPVPHVRRVALHGLACERCRVGELCVDETVTDLVRVLETDPSAKVRHDAVFVTLRLGRRDPRVPSVLARVARDDADPLVRQVALAAVEGRRRDVRSRKALRRRVRTAKGGC